MQIFLYGRMGRIKTARISAEDSRAQNVNNYKKFNLVSGLVKPFGLHKVVWVFCSKMQ